MSVESENDQGDTTVLGPSLVAVIVRYRTVFAVADGGEATGIQGDGQYVYVADNQDGVEILDIDDPEIPREVAQFKRASAHGGIAYDGQFIYLADGHRGLVVFQFQ